MWSQVSSTVQVFKCKLIKLLRSGAPLPAPQYCSTSVLKVLYSTSMYLHIKTCVQWFKIHDRPLLYIWQISGWATAWMFSTLAAVTGQLWLATCSTRICWGRRISGIGRIWFLLFWTCEWILGCAGHLWRWSLGARFQPSGAQVVDHGTWRLYTVVLLLVELVHHLGYTRCLLVVTKHKSVWLDVGDLSVCVVTKHRLRTPWMVEWASRILFSAH